MTGLSNNENGNSQNIVEGDFRSLFETHPSPMWVYDPASLRFLIVNKAAQDLYGYSLAEFADKTVLDLRPDYEKQRMLDAVQSRSDMEKAERWEHLKSNGEIFQVLTYGREVRLEGRKAILAIVQDRSELNAAQRETVATRTLLDSIVDNLPVGVFVKDMQEDGRYISFNEACGVITGLSPGQALNKTDRLLFPAEQAAKFRHQDERAFVAASITLVDEEIERLDGTRATLRTVRRPLPSADGRQARYLVGIIQDVTEERHVEARLEQLAMHDALTGLPNRASFTDHIRRRMEDTSTPAPFALLYVDVDHFKNINDSIGHPAGDTLLCEIAKCLLALKEEKDFVARLGGDEFAVLLDLGKTYKRALTFAERFFSALQTPVDLDGIREYVSCSIGIALGPKDGDTVDALMRSADLALYAAKDAGRSTYRTYRSDMRIAAELRHSLATELRQAIADQQFEVHYQPIVQLKTGKLTGFEALVRWRHPTRGLVPPAEFIPVAEENGLISQIGEYVMREACARAAQWPGHLKIAVNISVSQFRDSALLETIISVLHETALPPERLEIEVTESVFLAENIQGIPMLKAMKALGVRIAIDDFGTGYSSLSYLRTFPFDKIKLDKSFVSGIQIEAGGLAIARAVVGIAKGFKATALAEGVETEQQLRLLRAEGFNEAQGFLLGKPMLAEEAEAMISQEGNRGGRRIA
jgi:diguanylate cyclase (GGDEF)-like protein/PAS domain S-box-containing protein